MISGEEFARRMHRVSQMRALGLALKRAALEAYRAGKIPYRPHIDIRSDIEYWREKQKEYLARQGQEENQDGPPS